MIGFYNVDSKLKVLKAAKKLADLPRYEDLRIVPDLTKEQRCEEEELRKEAEKLNSEMNREESLNFEYRLVGQKGEKRLVRSKLQHQPNSKKRKKETTRKSNRKRVNSELPTQEMETSEEEETT